MTKYKYFSLSHTVSNVIRSSCTRAELHRLSPESTQNNYGQDKTEIIDLLKRNKIEYDIGVHVSRIMCQFIRLHSGKAVQAFHRSEYPVMYNFGKHNILRNRQ